MPTGNKNELSSIFDILKKTLPQYEEREEQKKMAAEVFSAIKGDKRLIIEAGTGVGKTFAYLIPAILSKKKTIISTSSITLQNQLVEKDLLLLSHVFNHRFTYALLKGKNNYLCLLRNLDFGEVSERYMTFADWVSKTKTGDKEELPFIPEFWSEVSCDHNDCNQKSCLYQKKCFYYSHLKSLGKVDIIVVNHHLLVYDLLLSFKLLPFHKLLIADEAHHLENVISSAFGSELTSLRFIWLLNRLREFHIKTDKAFKGIETLFKRKDIPLRATYPIPQEIIDDLSHLKETLAPEAIIKKLEEFRDASGNTKELIDSIENIISIVSILKGDMEDFIEQKKKDRVYYANGNKKMLELKSNLIESAKAFSLLSSGYNNVILTSATLTTKNNFDFIKERLGVQEGYKEVIIGSPFDYKRQSAIYIDNKLPLPNEDQELYQKESLKVIEELIGAAKGRTMVLFTSYQHLRYVAANIEIPYPCKTQGDAPPPQLIEWFTANRDSVLLATTTFWQGIDIKGESLSLVIITKLPFVSPDDPVYNERCKRLEGRWFKSLALPSATILLRQGVGRLIRGKEDRGVIAILDTRLVKNSYGKQIISSLPQTNIVHTIEEVKEFFDSAL
ncbi:MAG: ATP-dependent DNA helicase [Nitrospinota bacterium]|nr:ATP-dependent DNA helicase [Nitrospinota bacterium]